MFGLFPRLGLGLCLFVEPSELEGHFMTNPVSSLPQAIECNYQLANTRTLCRYKAKEDLHANQEEMDSKKWLLRKEINQSGDSLKGKPQTFLSD